MDPVLARNVAKWLVKSLVAAKTARLAADAVDHYTRFDKDNLAVELGTGAVGMIVAAKFEPVTDKLVDKTANFLAEKRANRRTKKESQPEK